MDCYVNNLCGLEILQKLQVDGFKWKKRQDYT